MRSTPRSRRLILEALEDRVQPATSVAPDLLSQHDTGVSSYDNITRIDQPAFAGTSMSPAGSVVTLLIDGIAVASTTLTRGGASTVTLQPTTPLSEGTHVARFRDSSSSKLSNPLTFTIDKTAPDAPPVPVLVDADDPAAAIVLVSANAGDRLHVFVEGQKMLSIIADGAPQAVTMDLTFLDLTLPFEIETFAEDSAGNTSKASPTLTVNLNDTPPVAPAAPTNLFLAPASDTGVYDDDRITQLTTLTLGGEAEPGTVVTLYVDGVASDAQPADAGGLFALVAGALAEGSHTFWVTATNAGGESDPSDPITVIIDTTAPVVTDAAIDPVALSPNNDGVQDTASFTFVLSEPASVTAYFYDENNLSLGAVPLGLLDVGNHIFDLDVSGFLDGSYAIDVVAIDLADNIGDLASTSFTVDRTPPTIPTVALVGGANTTTPTFTGTSDPDTIVDIYEGSAYLGTALVASDGTWTAPVPLAEGTHTLTIVAWDDAGNPTDSDPFVITIDTSALVADAGPDQTTTAGSAVTLTVAGFASATWSLVSASNGQVVPSVTGMSFAFTPTAAGTYVFQVVGVDALGNAVSDTVTITVNGAPANQPPSLGTLTATTSDILEDAADPDGIIVADLVALLGITDTSGSAAGLAITAADASHGFWQFAPNGADWTPLGDVAESMARLLAADAVTRLRFVPTANWFGDAALSLRAWDQTDVHANGSTASVLAGTSFSAQSATIVQPVLAVNDAPTLHAPASLSAAKNGQVSPGTTLSVTDIDAGTVRVTVTIDHGTLTLADVTTLTLVVNNGTSSVTFEGPIATVNERLATLIVRPSANFVGTANLQITVDDLGATGAGGSLTANATVPLTVINQPPRPIVSGLSYSTQSNQPLNASAATVAAAFRDDDGDALTFAVVNPPASGTVTVNTDGSFRYVPPSGFTGTTMFSLRAFDGMEWSDVIWITIQVTSATGLRR